MKNSKKKLLNSTNLIHKKTAFIYNEIYFIDWVILYICPYIDNNNYYNNSASVGKYL